MHQIIPHFVLENYAAGQTSGAFTAASLFIDLSGFSAMTEVLLTHGHHGAEVLADVMRKTFDPLIRSVFEQDGFITTQEGDAFTALFPQRTDADECIQHALTTALQIQQNVSANLHHKTLFGVFDITVKVGLAFGEVSWGIVISANSARAAYYFRGPAVEDCTAAEHHAQLGEIVLAPSIYERVRPLVKVDPVEEYARLVEYCGALSAARPAAPAPFDLDLAGHFLPREIFTQASFGEFRQVAYLFVSLPTVRAEVQLHNFMQTVFELQDQYGGILQLFFGDKGAYLLVFWGAPVSYENDIDRSLNFILELQKRTAIPVKCGITYRIAHTGFIGSDLKEDFSAFGPGANLAARYMTGAQRGEIWVDENIARRAGQRFELESAGAKSFKGFAQPQQVFILLDRKDDIETFFDGELIGREAELCAMAKFIQPLFEGKFGGVLAIWGEPGMGKSRLVYEFLERLKRTAPVEFVVFLGQTDEILREPLNPLRYWLRRYFQVSESQGETRNKRSFNRKLDELVASIKDRSLADELDRTRSFLGALIGLEWTDSLYDQLDARGRYENTTIALTTLLQAESLGHPVILLLEDAHLIDEDTKALLLYLLRSFTAAQPAYPVAILLTGRSEGTRLPLEDFSYLPITLEHLGRSDLAALAATHLDAPAGNNLLDLLEMRADGNPFFAEQILRYLKEVNLLIRQKDRWQVSAKKDINLPIDVNALLIARLDRLTKDVKEVVQTASVLGREFDLKLLSRMQVNPSALLEKVTLAEQEGIWSALGEIHYIFKHILMRDAAYQMQLHARRQVLHAAAVEALENIYQDNIEDHAGELAYHAELAGMMDKARRYLNSAADIACSAFQNSLAVDYYTRALALTPPEALENQYELLLARELVYRMMGRNAERQIDLAHIETLLPSLHVEDCAARLALRQAQLALDTDSFAEARNYAEKAVELALAANIVELAVTAYRMFSIALFKHRKLDQAAEQANRGLDLARQTGSRREESLLLNSLGLISIEQENYPAAQIYFEQSLQITQEAGDLLAQPLPLNNLGMVLEILGDYSGARHFYEQSLVLARKIGYRYGEGLVLGNLGWVSGMLGEYTQARTYAEQNLRIAREVNATSNEAYCLINLSAFAGNMGDYPAAEQYAEQGRALAQQIGDLSAEAWSLTYLGHTLLTQDRLTEAAEAYQAALDLRMQLGQAVLATEPAAGLARIALAGDDQTAAQKYLQIFLPHLLNSSLQRTGEPIRVFLTGYLVLAAAKDPRAAEILETAYNLLQTRAASILDENTCRSFLVNIPHHAELLAAWSNHLI